MLAAKFYILLSFFGLGPFTAPEPPSPPAPASPEYSGYTEPQPFSLDLAVHRASLEHQVDPELIRSIIAAESGFQSDAVSPKGAMGYMQLMPETAAGLGYDSSDPEQNILAGSKYISQMIDRYESRRNGLRLAIAAYNAGPGNVDRFRGIPPFPETRSYVKRVMNYYSEYGSPSKDVRVLPE